MSTTATLLQLIIRAYSFPHHHCRWTGNGVSVCQLWQPLEDESGPLIGRSPAPAIVPSRNPILQSHAAKRSFASPRTLGSSLPPSVTPRIDMVCPSSPSMYPSVPLLQGQPQTSGPCDGFCSSRQAMREWLFRPAVQSHAILVTTSAAESWHTLSQPQSIS
ncbi:hypothetical protein LY78DRAFT_304669 [Colletotrichum sublineola]|nr:hypothetical protein LY78DRAFT_304669 [Colletotrichum sublineola]